MSGSGNGNGGGGWSGPDDAVDCANFFERTVINSPNPAVLKTLKVGDVLQVTVDAKRVVKVVTDSGDVAGSVTSARMLQLINCIEDGFTYVAIVKSIDGGRASVEIRPESK